MSSPCDPPYTIAEIAALPDGVRAELIDGQIHYIPHPTLIHDTLCYELRSRIQEHIRKTGSASRVFSQTFGIFLYGDDSAYVLPDVYVVCDPDRVKEYGCLGAPDLVMEVVSPDTRTMDLFTKLFHYRTAGVREYWIISSEKHFILVYTFPAESDLDLTVYSFQDTVPVGIFDGLSIDFRTILRHL